MEVLSIARKVVSYLAWNDDDGKVFQKYLEQFRRNFNKISLPWPNLCLPPARSVSSNPKFVSWKSKQVQFNLQREFVFLISAIARLMTPKPNKLDTTNEGSNEGRKNVPSTNLLSNGPTLASFYIYFRSFQTTVKIYNK